MMTMNEPLLRNAFETLWQGSGVRVAIDPKHDQVIIPNYLTAEPAIILDYDPDAIVPINDLRTDEEGITATLSFDRTPCQTFVPWKAVIGISPRCDTTTTVPATKPKRHLSIVK